MKLKDDTNSPYLLFMLVLSAFSIILLGADIFLHLSSPIKTILMITDNIVCFLFLLDFIISIAKAKNRWRYFYTWGWLDLLSSIPSIDFLRIFRASRVFRILRVLRGIRSTKILAQFILHRRTEGIFLAISLFSLLTICIASIAILYFEDVPEANIKSAGDAIWWAAVTITTVGYGDKYPISTEGRILAAILMVAGVGIIGAFSGFIASWFLKPNENNNSNEIETLNKNINRLTEELQCVKTMLCQQNKIKTQL